MEGATPLTWGEALAPRRRDRGLRPGVARRSAAGVGKGRANGTKAGGGLRRAAEGGSAASFNKPTLSFTGHQSLIDSRRRKRSGGHTAGPAVPRSAVAFSPPLEPQPRVETLGEIRRTIASSSKQFRLARAADGADGAGRVLEQLQQSQGDASPPHPPAPPGASPSSKLTHVPGTLGEIESPSAAHGTPSQSPTSSPTAHGPHVVRAPSVASMASTRSHHAAQSRKRRASRADFVAPRGLPSHLLDVESLEEAEEVSRQRIVDRQRRAAARRQSMALGPVLRSGRSPMSQVATSGLALSPHGRRGGEEGDVRWNEASLNALSASPDAGERRSVLLLSSLRAGDDMAHLEAQQALGRLLAAEWTRGMKDDREQYDSVATFRCGACVGQRGPPLSPHFSPPWPHRRRQRVAHVRSAHAGCGGQASAAQRVCDGDCARHAE